MSLTPLDAWPPSSWSCCMEPIGVSPPACSAAQGCLTGWLVQEQPPSTCTAGVGIASRLRALHAPCAARHQRLGPQQPRQCCLSRRPAMRPRQRTLLRVAHPAAVPSLSTMVQEKQLGCCSWVLQQPGPTARKCKQSNNPSACITVPCMCHIHVCFLMQSTGMRRHNAIISTCKHFSPLCQR